jgi:cytochrome b561
VVLPDYQAHWTGGRLLLDGRADVLYDPAVQSQLQRTHVPGSTGLSWFVSPPVVAALYAPFALLPYGPSAVLWAVVNLALLVVAVRLVRPLLPQDGTSRLFVLAFLATAAVFEVMGAGQDSLLALVVLLVGLRLLLANRDGLAGAVLALGIFKPQLFVLVPVALLLQRRYRAVATGGGMAVGLVLLTLPMVGVDGWRSWLGALASPLYLNDVQVAQTWKMQSVSALGTALGGPQLLAYVLLVVGAFALGWRLRKIRDDTTQVWALTVLTTVVFSPHVMLYDLVFLLPVLAYLWSRLNTRPARLLAVAAAILLWSVPIRRLAATTDWAMLSAPWSALPLLGLWLLLFRGSRSHRVELDDGPGRPTRVSAGPAVAG